MEHEDHMFISMSKAGLFIVIAMSMAVGIGIGSRIMENKCRSLLNTIKVVDTIYK